MNVAVALPVDSETKARNRFAPSRRSVVVALVAIAVALLGLVYLLSPRTSESTDNAYLKADATSVAPRVGGLISEVLVRDNQAVRVGDPLVRLDTQQYDQRLRDAEAGVADAVAGVATARAALNALPVDEALATSRVTSARTSIAAADADFARAANDRDRVDALYAKGFASRRDADRIRSEAIGAASARDRSLAEREVSVREVAVASARRPVLQAELARAEALEARAHATLALARQDLGFTLIRAPMTGVVGNRQAQIGDFVQPGTRLLTLVPAGDLYVVANFKETQTRRMAVGQVATVSVDALDGGALKGRVESLAPASGSEFTLLPFEPSSGNFTKIVQRVAVRIRLDAGQTNLRLLRPGLSVTAKVHFTPD